VTHLFLTTLVADGGLVILTAGCVALGIRALTRSELGLVAVSASGVLLARLGSEALKDLIRAPRPCHEAAAAAGTICSGPTDWSFPSSHAAIAAALAVGWLILAGRRTVTPVLIAVAVCSARVLAGVHHVVDVMAGAALGMSLGCIALSLHGYCSSRAAASRQR